MKVLAKLWKFPKSRALKKYSKIVSVLLLLLLMFFIAICLKGIENRKAGLGNFCVDQKLLLAFPKADGLLMKPNILPEKWKIYKDNLQETERRIFFHETSGNGKLSMIQCCAVESAALHNPDRPVHLFLRPSKYCSIDSKILSQTAHFYSPAWLEVLSHYSNVSVVLLNEEHYFYGTPLGRWYSKGEWRQSQFETAHLSDYIRILTLKKGGGFYLDLDILTLRSYIDESFRNFVVYGSPRKDHISNGAMQLDRKHWLLDEILQLLVEEYYPDSYTYHGPDAMGEALRRGCGFKAGSAKHRPCNIQILPDSYFYPVPSITSDVLFQEDNNNITEKNIKHEYLAKIKQSFGIHLWNSISRLHTPLRLDSNQIVASIARLHCPLTSARAKDFKF